MTAETLTPVFTADDIKERVAILGKMIAKDYAGKDLLAVCVLKGAFIFFADLVRAIGKDELAVDFIRLSSYGNAFESCGHVIFSKDLETEITGKNVLVVEDIVDTGRSMQFLLAELASRKPASLRLAALVDKKERREVPVTVDYAGFTMNDGFIAGYGMDYAEKMRTLPAICILDGCK